MKKSSGCADPVALRNVTAATAAIASANAPSTVAAARGRQGSSAKRANTEKYSRARLAPSQASPLTSAQPIEKKLQTTKAAANAIASSIGRGRERRLRLK